MNEYESFWRLQVGLHCGTSTSSSSFFSILNYYIEQDSSPSNPVPRIQSQFLVFFGLYRCWERRRHSKCRKQICRPFQNFWIFSRTSLFLKHESSSLAVFPHVQQQHICLHWIDGRVEALAETSHRNSHTCLSKYFKPLNSLLNY